MIFSHLSRMPYMWFSKLRLVKYLPLTLLACSPSNAAENSFSTIQKEQLNNLIKQYILDHPEVIVDAIKRMQDRHKLEEKARVIAALKKNKQALEADPDAPVIGNPAANITVVEFFDYRCGYCKHVFRNMVKVLKEMPNVRFLLKEFPILGPDSIAASRASLAVWRTNKNKYREFHSALLETRGKITETKILSIAEKLGIDTNQLKKDIVDPAIDRILKKNRQLAEILNINGTPAFVVGDRLIPGALGLDTMKKLITAAGRVN